MVIDTAPTGHTLLLLDAANAYHRDVERNLTYIPDSVRRLLPQLRDPVLYENPHCDIAGSDSSPRGSTAAERSCSGWHYALWMDG